MLEYVERCAKMNHVSRVTLVWCVNACVLTCMAKTSPDPLLATQHMWVVYVRWSAFQKECLCSAPMHSNDDVNLAFETPTTPCPPISSTLYLAYRNLSP